MGSRDQTAERTSLRGNTRVSLPIAMSARGARNSCTLKPPTLVEAFRVPSSATVAHMKKHTAVCANFMLPAPTMHGCMNTVVALRCWGSRRHHRYFPDLYQGSRFFAEALVRLTPPQHVHPRESRRHRVQVASGGEGARPASWRDAPRARETPACAAGWASATEESAHYSNGASLARKRTATGP